MPPHPVHFETHPPVMVYKCNEYMQRKTSSKTRETEHSAVREAFCESLARYRRSSFFRVRYHNCTGFVLFADRGGGGNPTQPLTYALRTLDAEKMPMARHLRVPLRPKKLPFV